MTHPTIYGVWKHEVGSPGSRTVTTQTIREDGTFETHMVFALGDGCEQHIRHSGTIKIGDGTLKLTLEAGETKMNGCEDPSKNFTLRPFSPAEVEETKAMLAQEIPYAVESDRLTTMVRGPSGKMEIVYERQGA